MHHTFIPLLPYLNFHELPIASRAFDSLIVMHEWTRNASPIHKPSSNQQILLAYFLVSLERHGVRAACTLVLGLKQARRHVQASMYYGNCFERKAHAIFFNSPGINSFTAHSFRNRKKTCLVFGRRRRSGNSSHVRWSSCAFFRRRNLVQIFERKFKVLQKSGHAWMANILWQKGWPSPKVIVIGLMHSYRLWPVMSCKWKWVLQCGQARLYFKNKVGREAFEFLSENECTCFLFLLLHLFGVSLAFMLWGFLLAALPS